MAAKDTMLQIGELSKLSGVTPRTIRFYVQEGLLPEPEKKQRNLALYDRDCVEKIKAIKKAQNERFLPLVVIRQILEKSRFDYSVLDDPEPGGIVDHDPVNESLAKVRKGPLALPDEVFSILKRKKLLLTGDAKAKTIERDSDDRRLVSLLLALNDNGLAWTELISSMETIRNLVESIAEIECQALLSGVRNNPARDFHNLLRLEEKTLQNYITRVRHDALKNIVTRYKSDLDYAFLASADEGYAVQPCEIQSLIEELERSLNPRAKDIRKMNDLALAYSCLGNLEPSLRYLKRIRRFAPDDPETQLRWIWYRRFTRRRQDQNRIKAELEGLVTENPNYAMGRAFMAVWYGFDLLETDDPYEILRLTNRCLQELEAAEKNISDDLHDWVVINYIKGQLFGRLHVAPENLEHGITSFEKILARQNEVDGFYDAQKPFFARWLWPNLYLFLGTLYNRAGRNKDALKVLRKGRNFKMLPPYSERLENELIKAENDKP